MQRKITIVFAFAFILVPAGLAEAAGATAGGSAQSADLAAELETIREQMRRQQERLEQQQQRIERQEAEIARLRAEAGGDNGGWLDEQRSDEIRAIVHEVLADASTRERLFAEGGLKPVYDRGFVLRSPDDRFALQIGGRVQPRYEFTKRSGDAENLSSFYLRRVRLDFRGHLFGRDLTFRIQPDLSRTATLRDGWVNYRVADALHVRFGQFTVPFHWQRAVSGVRQHFVERSLLANTFGFPTGYDIGVALHGANEERTIAYGIGFFDGAGRNVRLSNSSGNMASGRLGLALMGTLPRDETDLAFSEDPQLAVGTGVQGAWQNEVRDWDLGRSPVGNTRADWIAGTGDVSFRWRGFSAAAEGYLRRVNPDDPVVDPYTGAGWGVTAGMFLIPHQLEVVGRYARLREDIDDPATRQTEWGVGVNLYHHGHDWKTRLQLLSHTADALAEQRIILEHHIQF